MFYILTNGSNPIKAGYCIDGLRVPISDSVRDLGISLLLLVT